MSDWDISIEVPSEVKQGECRFSKREFTTDWVANLPVTATGETAKRIYLALKEVSEYELPFAERLFFLEQITPVYSSILSGLGHTIHQGGLPLKDVTAQTARLSLEMLALKVIGYRQVLDALNASLFTGGLQRGKLKRLAMLRVMELLGLLFELYRYLAVPASPGLWLLFNRYYAIAELDKSLETRMEQMGGGGHTTIGTVFKSQLLLDPLNSHDFRQHELEVVKSLVGSLSRHVSINTRGDAGNPHSFCFRINEDAPASRFEPERNLQCEASAERRIINLAALFKALENLLVSQPAEADAASTTQAITRLAARKLLNGWQIVSDSRDQRSEFSKPVRLAHGLSNIATTLAQLPTEDLEQVRQDDVEGIVIDAPFGTSHISATVDGMDQDLHAEQMRQDDDLWNRAYVAIKPLSGHWFENYRESVASQLVEGQLLNHSPNGYGIAINHLEGGPSYRVGELVALEIEDDWHLASIRWVRPRQGEISMGLARIGSAPLPRSLVIKRNGNESQPMPVILLKHQTGQAAIILHNLNVHPSDDISFGEHASKTIGDLLETTPFFECYRLEDELFTHLEHQRQGEALDDTPEELTKEQLELLINQNKATAEQTSNEDHYRDVWAAFRNE